MSKTPEEIHAETQKKIDETRSNVAAGIPSNIPMSGVAVHKEEAKAGSNTGGSSRDSGIQGVPSSSDLSAVLVSKGVSAETLEDIIRNVLDKRKAETVQKLTPKEPDYRYLSEADAVNSAVYIPVIEHDLPDYMNVRLKDDEYIPIWVNKDQRQLGAKQAEGFEFLRKEDLASDFVAPLKFNSEGMYEYQDVVCMRVHKRIRFAKLRKFNEISKNQLKPAQAQENAKASLMEKVILGDPALDQAFASGAYKFYHTDT